MAAYDASMGDMDVIFAGGGTAACVAAGRLAKASPELKILLIEVGKNNYQDPTVVNPALLLTHLDANSKTALVNLSAATSIRLAMCHLEDWQY
jgi:alcohol oxidase